MYDARYLSEATACPAQFAKPVVGMASGDGPDDNDKDQALQALAEHDRRKAAASRQAKSRETSATGGSGDDSSSG